MNPLSQLTPSARRPRVVVSTLFYYKEDIARQFITTIAPQLAFAARTLDADVLLVVTLNYPHSSTVWSDLAREFPSTPAVALSILDRSYNLGFGASHRDVFFRERSDVFVVMNNDLFCEREDWLAALAKPILEGRAELVGAQENETGLRVDDGCGVPVAPKHKADFVDGSLLAFQTEAARRLGLFSPAFVYFYFEDSDLVLRYRQAGCRVLSVPVPHQHLRWSGSKQLPRFVVQSILDLNRRAFFARWSRYLQRTNRSFDGIGWIDLRALSRDEDVLDALPAALALTRDHPGVRWTVSLPHARFTTFFRAAAFAPVFAREPEPARSDWDRVWQARLPDVSDPLPAPLQHLRDTSAEFPTDLFQAHLLSLAGCSTDRPPSVPTSATRQAALVTCAEENPREGFHPSEALMSELRDALGARGYAAHFVTVSAPSGSDPHAAVAAAVRDLQPMDVVVTAAGFAATVAQGLKKPTFVITGARLEARAVWDWERSLSWSAPELSCTGCEQTWGATGRSYCLRRDVACMAPAQGPAARVALLRFLEEGTGALGRAMRSNQRVQSLRRQPSATLDLSSWPE